MIAVMQMLVMKIAMIAVMLIGSDAFMAVVLTMMIAMNTMMLTTMIAMMTVMLGMMIAMMAMTMVRTNPPPHPSPDTMPPGRWWRSWSSSRRTGGGTPAGPTLLRR